MDAAIRTQILSILDRHGDMTIATLREDGFPQATTVTYVHDGLTLYFGCGPDSQKAHNIARHPKVSAVIDKPQADWNAIEGLSLGGIAAKVTDPAEIARIGTLFHEKYKQAADYVTDNVGDIAFFRIDPVAISVLDYAKGSDTPSWSCPERRNGGWSRCGKRLRTEPALEQLRSRSVKLLYLFVLSANTSSQTIPSARDLLTVVVASRRRGLYQPARSLL